MVSASTRLFRPLPFLHSSSIHFQSFLFPLFSILSSSFFADFSTNLTSVVGGPRLDILPGSVQTSDRLRYRFLRVDSTRPRHFPSLFSTSTVDTSRPLTLSLSGITDCVCWDPDTSHFLIVFDSSHCRCGGHGYLQLLAPAVTPRLRGCSGSLQV